MSALLAICATPGAGTRPGAQTCDTSERFVEDGDEGDVRDFEVTHGAVVDGRKEVLLGSGRLWPTLELYQGSVGLG